MITQKSLLRGTLLFGLSQIIISLFLVLRAKVLAIYIGPSGLGDFGLITGLLILLISIFQLGIDRSSVRAVVKLSGLKKYQRLKISALNSFVMLMCFTSLFIVIIFLR